MVGPEYGASAPAGGYRPLTGEKGSWPASEVAFVELRSKVVSDLGLLCIYPAGVMGQEKLSCSGF